MGARGSPIRRAVRRRSAPEHHEHLLCRDVGYAMERIDLDAAIEEMSATEVRKKTFASH
jgi:hypothetical protein